MLVEVFEIMISLSVIITDKEAFFMPKKLAKTLKFNDFELFI